MNKPMLKLCLAAATLTISLSACALTPSQKESSPEGSGEETTSQTSESSQDPYEGRIKNKDFRVINISNEWQNSNDPRFYEDPKPLSTLLKADTYKLYCLDAIDDVYYLPLSTFVDLYKGDFKDGVVNEVTESNGVAVWTSTFQG